jgi:hypothetical protein
MNIPLCAATILEHLQGMGLSNVETSREDEFGCWRIRVQGGPVVHIHDNGKVSFSGLKARILRKSLGLTGQSGSCCFYSEVKPSSCGAEPGVRLRKAKAATGAPKTGTTIY